MKTHTRVAVIGGGVVGASVLYHLAKAGWTDIVLIERDELTSGSTWHAAGGMHTLNSDPNVTKLQEYTIKLYQEIEKASGQSCGIHITTGIDLAGTTLSDNYIGSRFRDTLEGNNGADGLAGGKGRDRIIGGFGNDTVAGDSGKDRLYGDSGNDSISGGKGKDWIESGLGTDHLFGGKGADVFFFTIQEEAGKGASRDVIADFRSGVDTLDFSSFMTIGHFIGANSFHGGGKVEVNFFANTHILSGDVDGDGHADFELTLTGAHLVAGDIVF